MYAISSISYLLSYSSQQDNLLTMIKFLAIFALFASTSATPAGPPHAGPGPYKPHVPKPLPPPHPAPAPKHLPGPGPKYHPMPYAYTYGVKDEYSGVNFGENKKSDGNLVQGTYHVLLPDGRVQNVKYTADHYAGYIAEVSYDGPAKPYHPPVHAKPAPYHPPAPIHPGPHKG